MNQKMKIYLEYKDEKFQKFLEVWVNDKELICNYGDEGVVPKRKTQSFVSNDMALYEMHKLIVDKRGKGYAMLNAISSKEIVNFPIINIKEVDKDLYDFLEGTHRKCIVINEDITLKELDLDTLDSFVDVIIIDANLKVDGGIINDNCDNGVSLIVTGDVQADYLTGGGSEIYLQGKTFIHTFVIGHYNGGILSINNLDVPIEINSDHHMDTHGSIKYYFNLFDDVDDIDLFIKIFTKKAKFVTVEDDDYSIDIDEILPIICNNKERMKFYLKILKHMNNAIELVNKDGMAIEGIVDPNEEVKLAALKENGMALKFIKNPTLEMQKIALSSNVDAFEYIQDPTPEMILVALKYRSLAIRFVKNQTTEMKMLALKNGMALEFIENPTLEMQYLAVKNSASAIKFIENPSEELQLLSIKSQAYAVQYIKRPTQMIQDYVLSKDIYLYKYINNPSKLTLEKIEDLIASGKLMTYSQLGSKEMQFFVKEEKFMHISHITEVHHGDLVIEGNYQLFKKERKVAGLYITGDLIVSGVLSTAPSYLGCSLLVGGSIKADSFINAGESNLYVEKDVSVEELLFLSNTSPLRVGGEVRTKNFIYFSHYNVNLKCERKFDFFSGDYRLFVKEKKRAVISYKKLVQLLEQSKNYLVDENIVKEK